MTAPRIDPDDVRSSLTVSDVVAAYGLPVRRSGAQLRLRRCPRCGETSKREGIAINPHTGRWLHHGRERAAGGDCSGDVIDLVAALEGLDVRRDWQRLLARCAELAGVEARATSARDREAQRVKRERVEAERQRIERREERQRRERALAKAGAHWRGLARRHRAGEDYLRRRGLDPAPLIARDVVRFERGGDVAVALHTADGKIISVARRILTPAPDAPKVLTLGGCPSTGTMIGSLPDIVHPRDVVLLEGLTDSLSASLAWPRDVVLGANGAGRLARIAAAAAPRIKLAGVRLLLIPDDDDAGVRGMIEAAKAALAAGLEYGRTLLVVETGAKDLTEAWAQGWRPPQVVAPSRRFSEGTGQ